MPSAIGPEQTVAHQRVDARARIEVLDIGGRTRIARLFQEGSAKIRMPKTADDPLEAILINTAGGLTGGDRLAWDARVGAGAALSLTTQACEKLYRAAEGRAEVRTSLSVGRGGRIAWLPQETIVYDRAALSRQLDAELDDGAEALILEATVFGRLARGESVRQAMFSDRWRIRRRGTLVHAEDFSIGPEVAATLARTTATGGGIAVATVLLVSETAEERLDAARHIVGQGGGVSAWRVQQSGKLLARLFAPDSYLLRKRLVPLIELLNGQAGLPKAWSL